MLLREAMAAYSHEDVVAWMRALFVKLTSNYLRIIVSDNSGLGGRALDDR